MRDVPRTKRRFAGLWYAFQQSRLTCARLLAALEAQYRGLPRPRFDAASLPLYAIVTSPSGVMCLAPRPYIIGSAQRTHLRCWTDADSGTAVLRAEGEVDVTTTAMLEDAIASSYRTGPRVIVDLGGLAYLDGSGIRVLEDAARSHPRQFVVVAEKREIHRLFEVLDLVHALPVVRSLEAAREYFGLE